LPNREFDPREYTRDAVVQELLLLERHIRDGSVYQCGCAFDQHLPLIEGLCSEGIKFAESEEERKFFDDLMHTAREARLTLQYGEEEEGNPLEWRKKGYHDALRRRLPPKEFPDPKAKIEYERGFITGTQDLRKKENPHNPTCTFKKEQVKPKGYFDPKSFRTICPKCPGAKCSACPEELECSTRVIIGCKKGNFARGKCQIGTEAHTILHA